MNKTGLNWKYFRICLDCGLISVNRRGSLANKPERTGIFRSWPLDRDLRAQDERVRRSNLGRPSGIGRSRGFGRAGGGVQRRRPLPAAALHWSTPISVLRGLFPLGFGSGMISATCVTHLRSKLGLAWLWIARGVVEADLHGELCWRGRSGQCGGLRAKTSSATETGTSADAHRG